MREKFEGYTGKISESEVLGETKTEQAEAKREFGGEYIGFRQAVDLVKDVQPFKDPADPHEKPFPHDLHATLAEALSLDNYEQLRFYTAVGSYLDKKHGVDAFFELDLGNGKSARATLDMTQNPKKQDYKADVVFQWPSEGLDRKDPGDRAAWQDKLREVSKELKDVLEAEARLAKTNIRSLSEKEIEESRRIAEEARHSNRFRAGAPVSAPKRHLHRHHHGHAA